MQAITRKRISIKGNNTSSKVDLIKQASILIKKAGFDITRRAAAISQIAVLISKEKDKAKQGLFLETICQENSISKTDLRARIKQLVREEQRQLKIEGGEEKELKSKTDKYELFLAEYFDIKYNKVSMKYEIFSISTDDKFIVDEYAILRQMRKNHLEISERALIEILKSPFVTKYDPIQDYIKSLKVYNPNKEPDYIKNVCSYLSMEDEERFYLQFKKHLVRIIAGAMEKDFNKQVFVLVGDGEHNQNSGKTTFIRWLTPPALKDYYIEDLSQDKDGLIALTDNIIINLDELESLSKYDLNKLKSILSKETIKVRPPYGKRAETMPRRATFFGSTNELNFLSDLTGNVRWLVFKFKDVVKPINWDYTKVCNINDIWRQAIYLFNSDFDYKLTRLEIEENERINTDYLTLPPEYDIINQIYLPGTLEKHQIFYTATDFVNELNIKTNHSIRFNNVRVGKVLRHLGFKQVTHRADDYNHPVKGYYVNVNPSYKGAGVG